MRIMALLAACSILLVGCTGDANSSGGTPSTAVQAAPATSATQSRTFNSPEPSAASTEGTREKPTGTVIKSAKSQFGMMLFDGTGQAIYLFDKERTTKPECYGACAEAWPPVLTNGTPIAMDGTRQSLLAITKRTDGTTQVTYGGHPLYFYAHEAKNEVKCHNIQGFGGLWLVVTPEGRAAAA